MKHIRINHIPSLLWGEDSEKIIIAIHGSLSSKSDYPIEVLAEEATAKGYQVLSYDLPEHGERINDPKANRLIQGVTELNDIFEYAKRKGSKISIWGNSLGAYYSLLALKDKEIDHAYFLAPALDMSLIINKMMAWFKVTKEQLKAEKEIVLPDGQTLYWDYFQYVNDHPITQWHIPTHILYGSKDQICDKDAIDNFKKISNCQIEISPDSEHYFHTENDILVYRSWLKKSL